MSERSGGHLLEVDVACPAALSRPHEEICHLLTTGMTDDDGVSG